MRYTRAKLAILCEDMNRNFIKRGIDIRYCVSTQYRSTLVYVERANGAYLNTIGAGTSKDCAFEVMHHALGQLLLS